MADKASNVVLNFKMDGQVEYANTIREINAIMNAAASEYKTHIAAMGRDANATDKLTAEKKKLEIQLEAGRKRTEQLRAEYDAMSKSTKTTTGQLANKYKQLQNSERAELALEQALGRVNEELSEEATAAREAEKELKSLANESGKLEAEQKRLTSTFKLQQAQLGENASESERLELAQQQLTKQTDLANRTIDNLERQLDQAKKAYGENSKEVMQLETRLNDARTSMVRFEQDMQKVGKTAGETEKELNEFGNELTNLLGGLAASGGISGIVEKSLDLSSLNTQIDITFDVPDESKEVIRDAVLEVTAVIEDQEGALEGVRRQWALNADASDEMNQKITEGAALLAKSYEGIDFTEVIQEINEISSELNISNEEALWLTNSLLKVGFPPEEIDIIAEYGQQLQRAGYDAEEIQAIMASGVDAGSWNIDNLLDGLKEGRVLVAEFGAGVDDSMAEMLEGTDISVKQLQEWGKAVSEGGETGKSAILEVAEALDGVEDKTKQNELGVKLFGTMWEDQGSNILDTLLNMGEHTMSAKENQDQFNESLESMNSDPAIQLREAMSDLLVASATVLTLIADIISVAAEWIQQNPELAATITGLITVLGILIGVAMGLAPIFTAISAAALAGAGAIGAIALPVLKVIGVIGALITIGVLLWKNWDTIKAKAGELKVQVVSRITELKDGAVNKFNELKDGAINKFNELRNKAGQVMEEAKEKILSPIESAKEKISNIIEDIKGFFSNMKLKIPKIEMPKLPRFTLTGEFSLKPPSVPKIGIKWNAKGAIFTEPTIFGLNGGRLQGAGEAGPEAALPLNEKTLGDIGKGIASTMGGNGEVVVHVYLDTDEVNTKLAPGMSKKINENNKIGARKIGVVYP